MADVVQYRLERMTDELDDFERRGLFTRAEIAEIVKRRRDFEYRLKRPKPLKEDFIFYIDYEKKLDALRKYRKQLAIRHAKEEEGREDRGGRSREKRKWKKTVSDFSVISRIFHLYRKAVTKYKGDLNLWFQYLEFCRDRRGRQMKQVLAKAIKFHPNVPGLWIYAAAWEFNQNLNVQAARSMMLCGLRSCPRSEDLWIEYLRMELTYLTKLKARRLALRRVSTSASKDKSKTDGSKEETEEFMPLEDGNVEKSEEDQNGELDDKEDLFMERSSEALQTIYHAAIESLPSSLNLRKQFIEILDGVDIGKSEELKHEIMENMRRDFFRDEDFWDWFARRQVGDVKRMKELIKESFIFTLNNVVKVYEEALVVLPSTKMFFFYSKFSHDVLEACGEDSVLRYESTDATNYISRIVNVYERAEQCGCLNEELACEYISFYLQMGRLQEARNLAERLCNSRLSESAQLWDLRISIELKCSMDKSVGSRDDLHVIFDVFRSALSKIPISQSECLWDKVLKLFSNERNYFKKFMDILILSLGKGGDNQVGYTVACSVINSVLQRHGMARARDTYKLFLNLPHPSLSFFKHCINLESSVASLKFSEGLLNARKLYELALRIYNQNKELWRDYYNMELKVGTHETASAVYWRARKQTDDAIQLPDASAL